MGLTYTIINCAEREYIDPLELNYSGKRGSFPVFRDIADRTWGGTTSVYVICDDTGEAYTLPGDDLEMVRVPRFDMEPDFDWRDSDWESATCRYVQSLRDELDDLEEQWCRDDRL